MPRRRHIVPDASVILPAFFPETMEFQGSDFDLTRRAQPLVDAIRMRHVEASAPDMLIYEFTSKALEKAATRGKTPQIDRAIVEQRIEEFLGLPIVYQPARDIAQSVLGVIRNRNIAPPDGWYLACAMYYDAELWISHDHADGFARHAREIHRNVHLLTEKRFA